MKVHQKATLFALWLLSQTLGVALPALSSVAERELPTCPVWEQSQAGTHGYDAGFQSGLGYDAEFPAAGSADGSNLGITTQAAHSCDSAQVFTMGMVGAPPVAGVRFDAAKSETVLVRHYTDTATRQLINESRQLRAGTYVTLPSEIAPRAGHLQIEQILEINPGRGATYIDVPTPVSNLRVPANGATTSGGAWQRQLIEPTPVDPNLWRRPPGRPPGGG